MARTGKRVTKPVVNRTREQILADLKSNAEFSRRMKFTKEVFFPALCDATSSIDDAQMLLQGFNSNIMESFLGLMKEKKLSELNLGAKLDMGNPRYKESVALLALFEDLNVYEAKEYIEGMKAELSMFVNEELKSRKLNTLTTKWLDEIV